MSGELRSRLLAGALILSLVGIIAIILAVSSNVPPDVEVAAPPSTLGPTVTEAPVPTFGAPTVATEPPTSVAVPIPTVTVGPSFSRGDSIGSIVIPAIELNWTVVAGVGSDELEFGPGHMPGSAMPGQAGNVVLSGHRTWHGAPFNRLDELAAGDPILLAGYAYTVTDVLVVSPTDTWVLEPRPGFELTLATCHPEGSDRQRLVVLATLDA